MLMHLTLKCLEEPFFKTVDIVGRAKTWAPVLAHKTQQISINKPTNILAKPINQIYETN